MKYKAGDKVKIKNREEWRKAYEPSIFHNLDTPYKKKNIHLSAIEKALNKKVPDRILTIKKIENHHLGAYYIMKELPGWSWKDKMIVCLCEPIETRFEILDL